MPSIWQIQIPSLLGHVLVNMFPSIQLLVLAFYWADNSTLHKCMFETLLYQMVDIHLISVLVLIMTHLSKVFDQLVVTSETARKFVCACHFAPCSIYRFVFMSCV
jgi:hypothetical protein